MVELDQAAACTCRSPTRSLASMNFLNEVAGRFPDAISLAAGRPYEGFFDTDDITATSDRYSTTWRERGSATRRRSAALLIQYGRTNGQIHDLIARMLAADEGIDVPAEAIVVTVGLPGGDGPRRCAPVRRPRRRAAGRRPCYVGITGAARMLGIDGRAGAGGPRRARPGRRSPRSRRAVRAAGRRRAPLPGAGLLQPVRAVPAGAARQAAAGRGRRARTC